MNDAYKTMDKKIFFTLTLAGAWIEENITIPANLKYSRGAIDYLKQKDGDLPCRLYINPHGGVEQIETVNAATEAVTTSITVTKEYE
ncbi:hypothetical protein [uncultured Altibacter sp.]|uniref:hypothetical protein n=1 Tax=uncultured Altibacter sp. TaxID=2506933 RepID=UPI0030D6CFF5